MECPYVDHGNVDERFNERIEYVSSAGTYHYYHHRAPDGRITLAQFCKLCGRKQDVFECWNEVEWKACRYYAARQRQQKEQGDEAI